MKGKSGHTLYQKSVSKNIRYRREKLQYSQEQLAANACTTERIIALAAFQDETTLRRIANALGMDYLDLGIVADEDLPVILRGKNPRNIPLPAAPGAEQGELFGKEERL